MDATITNYPDKKTFAYAELWSADQFAVLPNDWWPKTQLVSEDKGDQQGVGARYKVDIPAPCWIHWQGTTTGGTRLLQIQQAADGHPLDNPPSPGFLPVESGVNLITFGEAPEPEPEPPTPEPEPEEPLTLDEWLARFLDAPGHNDCQNYGVEIAHFEDPSYQVIGLHHLTGAENGGNHNLYIDVLTENGQPDLGVDMLVSNQDGPFDFVARASDTTPMWDIPLWKEDQLAIHPNVARSDIVDGISTAYPDEEPGTTWFHHSFYVVFRKVAQQPEPTPEPPAELPKARLITIYAGGLGRLTTPIFHYERYGEKGTDSEFWKLVIVLPGDDYEDLRDKIEQKLLEAIDDCQISHPPS